jgi:hypothetical protein
VEIPNAQMYAIFASVYTIFIVIILSWPREKKEKNQSSSNVPDETNPEKISYDKFTRYRKHFLVYGFPIGGTLGIGIHIPIIFHSIGVSLEKFPLLIQFSSVLFYLTFVLTMTIYRIYIAVKYTEDHERKKGITDGILVSFFLIQVFLFFLGNYEIFMPEFNTFLNQNATKSVP